MILGSVTDSLLGYFFDLSRSLLTQMFFLLLILVFVSDWKSMFQVSNEFFL